MSSWLFFSILAPVLWGFTVIFDNFFRRYIIQNDLVLSWFIGIIRLPTALVLLALAGYQAQSLSAMIFMTLSGVIWILPVFLYVKALTFEESTRIALLFAFTPIFTLILSYFFLNEQLTNNQMIAFLLILGGSIFAALKPHYKIHKKWQFSHAFWIIALACFFWAAGDVLFKGLEPLFSHFFSALGFFLLGNSLPAIFMISIKTGRKSIQKHATGLSVQMWLLMLINLAFSITAILSFTYALTLGKVALTNVISGIEPLTVFIFGAILCHFFTSIPKEDMSRRSLMLKAFSFVLMFAGLVYLQQ